MRNSGCRPWHRATCWHSPHAAASALLIAVAHRAPSSLRADTPVLWGQASYESAHHWALARRQTAWQHCCALACAANRVDALGMKEMHEEDTEGTCRCVFDFVLAVLA